MNQNPVFGFDDYKYDNKDNLDPKSNIILSVFSLKSVLISWKHAEITTIFPYEWLNSYEKVDHAGSVESSLWLSFE